MRAGGRMLGWSSGAGMSSVAGSGENRGQMFGATKQMCGRSKSLAGSDANGPSSRRGCAAVRSRQLSVGPCLCMSARGTQVADVAGALTVHHSDRQPKIDLFGTRREAAADDGGDQKACQSGRCTEVEAMQGGAQGRIDAERAKSLPDVDEIGANENQTRYPHV